ncbi:MAG: hypothetical protein AAB848_02330 [Patescibacteria group bacterium]
MPENPYVDPVENLIHKVSAVSSERRFAISCYIPVFNIVTCVLTSVKMATSQFCLFHARQGLVLFGLWFLTILAAVISPILSLMMWGVVLVLHFAGMVISYRMQKTEIPIIGQIANKIPEQYLFVFLTKKHPPESSDTLKDSK